jgi:hypothetical protein
MKILTICLLCFVMVSFVSCVSGYICIDANNDNDSVIDFKNKINILAAQNDIKEHNLTKEAFYLKLKYFGPCR